MKKIAFVIRMFQEKNFHGGGEKLFYNLIKSFAKDGYLVDIYCSQSDVERAGHIHQIFVINENYDHNQPNTMENFYRKVREQIKDRNYNFVISENITPAVDITFLQGHSLVNRQKTVKSPIEAFLYKFRKVKRERMKHQAKWLKQEFRRIITVSNVLKQDIINNFGVDENKIGIVHPGVDIPLFVEERGKDRPLTFGLVAPGFQLKGGYIFLKALKILKQKKYNFKARIIYPKYKGNLWVKLLTTLYNIKDNVEFLPYQENIADFYASIDCLVVPSYEDTFNMAALEAMASSKPVIISSKAGASDLIRDKVNGFTFEIGKNSAKNLFEKMLFIIYNPMLYKGFCEAALETAKEYSWERMYKDFQAELRIVKNQDAPYSAV